MTQLRMTDLEDIPTVTLLQQALVLSHNRSKWEDRSIVVATLQLRGDTETFDAARNWCASKDSTERELAADLLSQFGERVQNGDGGVSFSFASKTVPLLEELIDDSKPSVVAAAVHGLGWHNAYDIILARTALVVHSSSSVRFAVACSLNGAESRAAIDALIILSSDPDDDVRDRANWVLQASKIDTPEIRAAFIRNLGDAQIDTRCDAMVGLARRKDERVISYIKKELAADSVFYIALEAAGHMASPDLVKPLEELRCRSDKNKELLDRALNRCKGIFDPNDDEPWVKEDEIVVPPWAIDKK